MVPPLAGIDVIIEGFKPGVAKRLKIDYNTVQKINPGTVSIVRLPGMARMALTVTCQGTTSTTSR